jgi:hypothetical protein
MAKVEITDEIIKSIKATVEYDLHDELKNFWGYIEGENNEEVTDTKLVKTFEKWFRDKCDDKIALSNLIQEIKKSPHFKIWSDHTAYDRLILNEYLWNITNEMSKE